MTPAGYIAVMLLLCACLVAVLVKTAPMGWEDDDGFHRGDPRDGEG
jgi:hypothetical protein